MEGKEKGRVVFHELWISEAALSAHRHQLTRREGKGQQRTRNRGGTERREKERNCQRMFDLICDCECLNEVENVTELMKCVIKISITKKPKTIYSVYNLSLFNMCVSMGSTNVFFP